MVYLGLTPAALGGVAYANAHRRSGITAEELKTRDRCRAVALSRHESASSYKLAPGGQEYEMWPRWTNVPLLGIATQLKSTPKVCAKRSTLRDQSHDSGDQSGWWRAEDFKSKLPNQPLVSRNMFLLLLLLNLFKHCFGWNNPPEMRCAGGHGQLLDLGPCWHRRNWWCRFKRYPALAVPAWIWGYLLTYWWLIEVIRKRHWSRYLITDVWGF